jgi:hypothetical protein
VVSGCDGCRARDILCPSQPGWGAGLRRAEGGLCPIGAFVLRLSVELVGRTGSLRFVSRAQAECARSSLVACGASCRTKPACGRVGITERLRLTQGLIHHPPQCLQRPGTMVEGGSQPHERGRSGLDPAPACPRELRRGTPAPCALNMNRRMPNGTYGGVGGGAGNDPAYPMTLSPSSSRRRMSRLATLVRSRRSKWSAPRSRYSTPSRST